jgi:predicted secreted protein
MTQVEQDYGEWCEEQIKARDKEIQRLNKLLAEVHADYKQGLLDKHTMRKVRQAVEQEQGG